MQDELSIEKARVAILVEERNELLRKVFQLEEQVRRLTQRAPDALRVCGKCGLSEQNHADSLCNPNYSAGNAKVSPLGENNEISDTNKRYHCLLCLRRKVGRGI